MRHNKLALYVHLVWSTWDRQRLITAEIEERLHHLLHSEANRLSCKVLAINGVEDHVHLLLEMPPTLCIADLVKSLKGTSSHFVNETLQSELPFKWQASYSAFTVSRWDVRKAVGYIQKQKEHHASGKLIEELESMFQPKSGD